MIETDVKISVPFKSLLATVKNLKLKEKKELLELIEQQIEEEFFETNSIIKNEIHDAREAYQKGNYISLEEYKNQNKDRLS